MGDTLTELEEAHARIFAHRDEAWNAYEKAERAWHEAEAQCRKSNQLILDELERQGKLDELVASHVAYWQESLEAVRRLPK